MFYQLAEKFIPTESSKRPVREEGEGAGQEQCGAFKEPRAGM